MAALLILLCLALSGWGWIQLCLGEVYQRTGITHFSPMAWIKREESPFKFWGTVLSQGVGGLILAGLAWFRVS